MVRTILVDDILLSYLTNVSRNDNYAVGLILGQTCLSKDYIVHFAKTPPFQPEEDKKANTPIKNLKSIEEINNDWVADHARQATRMLPGGLYVLGIFVITPEDIFNPFNTKIKSLLQSIHSQLTTNKYLFGSSNTEKLVLHYNSITHKYYSKSFDVNTHNNQPVDIKPSQKKWIIVQCDFKLNNLRFLTKNQGDWPLEKHIALVMDEIHSTLNSAVFLFDGEFRDKDESLESIGKKKSRSSKSGKGIQEFGDTLKPLEVTMLHSVVSSGSDEENIYDSCGRLRLIGKIASKLWLQPKLTISEASVAIKEDILRSLTARLEMHWDSLTEEENSEDMNSVHEPPRRVLVALPNSEVALSDYLFPGEGPQEAKVSLEELLDIKIDGKLNITDVEGQADLFELDKFYKGALDSDNNDILPKVSNQSNFLMYTGLALSLLVLFIAILFKLFM